MDTFLGLVAVALLIGVLAVLRDIRNEQVIHGRALGELGALVKGEPSSQSRP